MKLKDQRIKMMNELLNGIKVLKLYAWEMAFIRRLNSVREKELQCIRKKAIVSSFSTAIWTFAPILVGPRRYSERHASSSAFSRYA
jgi:ATP-binding cassette, subfamily C (CFTR/MRP), member 1